MKLLYLLTVLVFAQACNLANDGVDSGAAAVWQPLTFADSVAAAHGFEHWNSVERFDFRFDVEVNDTVRTSRAWSWYPDVDSVIRIIAGDSIGFLRAEVDSSLMKADGQFINDTYWVLMPYYLIWSKDGYEPTVQRNQRAPLSKKMLNKLTVAYDAKGGYTPGDAYDLYVDEDYRLTEWVFRKGGQQLPSMVTSWSDYRTIEKLLLPTDHTSEGPVRIFHPVVAVVPKQ